MENIEHGKRVKVLKRSENESRLKEIHNGVVVGLTSHFAKVFNKETDVNIDSAEWFAIDGKDLKTVAW
jgi:hypothetical protein